jgi:CheY-like chemotaxis protein
MDGFEMAAAIRNAELPDQHTPIIAVTANALRGEAQRCLDCGMDDFLTKPLRLQELGTILSRWLIAPQVWDAQALARTLGHSDTAVHDRLLQRFLRHASQQLHAMQSHCQADEIQAVCALAHNIKSAARTVGAVRVGELCSALEMKCNAEDTIGAQALVSEVVKAFDAVKAYLPAHVVEAASIEP